MTSKFPNEVFVALREPGEDEFFVCEGTPDAAIEDDGPTLVATYKLVEVHKFEKQSVSKKAQNRTY